MRERWQRGLCVLAALAPVAAVAGPGALDESPFIDPLPQVLTPTRLPQDPLTAPLAVTVIDRELIRDSAARTLPELLRLVPGFAVGHRYGSDAVVAYHGHAAGLETRFLVMVDGRPVRTPAFGDEAWMDLPLGLADIERIEVIRGPNAVTYGSNAFLGVVSITTRAPVEDAVEARLVRRQHGAVSGQARFTLQRDDLAVGLHLRGDDDPGHPGEVVEDQREGGALRLRVDYAASPRDQVGLRAGASANDYREGDPGEYRDPPRARESRYRFVHLDWRREFADGALRLQAFHNEHRSDDVFFSDIPVYFADPAIPDHLRWDVGFDVARNELDLEWRHRASRKLRYVLGGSLREDRHRSPGFFDTDATLSHRIRSGFGQLEWRPTAAVVLQGGLRLEDSEIAGASWLPRLSAVYRPGSDRGWRLTYSEGTHLPQLVQEHGRQTVEIPDGYPFPPGFDSSVDTGIRTLSRGGLDVERIRELELGHHRRLGPGSWVDVKAYVERLDDLIARTCVPFEEPGAIAHCGGAFGQVATEVNRDSADIRGLEVNLDWRPVRGTRVWAAYGYAHARGPEADTLPRHTLSTLVSRRFSERWRGSLAWYHASPIDWEWGNASPQVDKVDARLERRWRAGATDVSLALVGENLAGPVADYRGDLEWDRRWRLELSVAYR